MRRPNLRPICVLVCCCGLVPVSHSCGETLTFDYSGSVALGGGTVFGMAIEDSVPVTGQLIVDTAAAMTHNFNDGRLGYRQTTPSGFTATFGSGASSVDVVSSEYLIVIGNNVIVGTADSVTFLFTTDLVPPLTTPLVVEGLPRKQGDYNGDGAMDDLDYTEWKANFGTSGGLADGSGNGKVDTADYVLWRDGRLANLPVGFFAIEFLGGSELFSSSSLADANLATNLSTSNFSSMFNIFGDIANGPDVFFDVSAFSLRVLSTFQVPEPGGLIVLISGVFMILPRRRRAPGQT